MTKFVAFSKKLIFKTILPSSSPYTYFSRKTIFTESAPLGPTAHFRIQGGSPERDKRMDGLTNGVRTEILLSNIGYSIKLLAYYFVYMLRI